MVVQWSIYFFGDLELIKKRVNGNIIIVVKVYNRDFRDWLLKYNEVIKQMEVRVRVKVKVLIDVLV